MRGMRTMVGHHGSRLSRAFENELKGIALFVDNRDQAIGAYLVRPRCCRTGIERPILHGRCDRGVACLAGKTGCNGSERKHEFLHMSPFCEQPNMPHILLCVNKCKKGG